MSLDMQGDTKVQVRQEEPVEPALPIVDPQHHLHDKSDRRYLFFDFLNDLASGHNIVATVAIEGGAMYRADGPPEFRPVGETEFYNGAAAMSASGRYGQARVCAGIVGHVDLRLGACVESVIEAHVTAGGGRFRGVRMTAALPLSSYATSLPEVPAVSHIGTSLGTPRDPTLRGGKIPPGMLLDPTLREGLACLARMGLSFDVHVNHPQLGEVLDLARAVPQATMILNHCGQPLGVGPFAGRHKEVFPEWSAHIHDLASCANLFVKLGGLRRAGIPVSGTGVLKPGSKDFAAAWRPYFETCIQAFGPDRCMFESNFPSDKVVCDYGVLWNAFKHITANYSDTEKTALFSGTAGRAYRLSNSWTVK